MTAVNSIHPLVLHTVQHVSSDRLQRAVCGLAEGSLTVSLTRQTATEIRALVKNGDGGTYSVTLPLDPKKGLKNMAVKVRQHKGAWWVFIDHKGKRKAKRIGTSKRAADQVAEKIQAKFPSGSSPLRRKNYSLAFLGNTRRNGSIPTPEYA